MPMRGACDPASLNKAAHQKPRVLESPPRHDWTGAGSSTPHANPHSHRPPAPTPTRHGQRTSDGQHHALGAAIQADEVGQHVWHLGLIPHKHEVLVPQTRGLQSSGGGQVLGPSKQAGRARAREPGVAAPSACTTRALIPAELLLRQAPSPSLGCPAPKCRASWPHLLCGLAIEVEQHPQVWQASIS